MGIAKIEVSWDAERLSPSQMVRFLSVFLETHGGAAHMMILDDGGNHSLESLARHASADSVNKIQAIKTLRTLSEVHLDQFLGLKEAKDLIDRVWPEYGKR